jgi:hypothetical protein
MKQLTKKDIDIFRKSFGANSLELSKILNVNHKDLLNICLGNGKVKIYLEDEERLKSLHKFCRTWDKKQVGRVNILQALLFDLLEAETLDHDAINCLLENIATFMKLTRKDKKVREARLITAGFKPISKNELQRKMMRAARSIC